MRKFVLGREGYRFFQGQLRCFQFARAEIDDPQVRQRIEIVGTLRQDFLVLFLRGAKLTAIKILLCLPRDWDQFFGDRRLRRRFHRRAGAGARIFRGREAGLENRRIAVGNGHDRLAQ